MKSIFDERCNKDPQGVIKDLLAQISRQAKTIHSYMDENKLLKDKLKKYESTNNSSDMPNLAK